MKKVLLTELRSMIADELEMMRHAPARRSVREAFEDSNVMDELSELRPGDRVDVMGDGFADIQGVEVDRLLDDVADEPEVEAGYGEAFTGPGFVGLTPDGDEMVFSLDQIVPGSKAKYYFPNDEVDGYERDVPNPYRRMAGRNALDHIERG